MCSRDSSMSAFHMGGDDSNTGISFFPYMFVILIYLESLQVQSVVAEIFGKE